MKSLLTLLPVVFLTALGSPIAEDLSKRADRGSETVSGIGAHKQAILNAGGNTLDLAIAMLEIKTMSTADYPYGDGKTYDSANFGLFKQNWGMLRVCASRYGFQGQSENDWNNGAELNSNVYADVASRWDCQEYYGYDKWFGGHRDGATGLANPYTQDITKNKDYKNAVEWIQQQIDSNDQYKTDDTRFWVYIPPI
ncbi:Hypothetical protein PENO1_081010 [Penicillium occitanis (nom. inval.)]|nr:Hypothetical protein PENO1_081010 [Penicillium occitanis (nom. inval.)]PCG98713.1 hypothetical protein PENOC_061720 [Penicillium occitanis (nom. inval.)]